MARKRTHNTGTDTQIDDSTLWAKVTSTVTPAKRDDVLISQPAMAKKPPQKAKKSKAVGTAGSLKPVIKTTIVPADLRSSVPVQRAGIDNASARRLTKGNYEIDARLDLHGKTEAEAHKALQQFILSNSRQGARTVLVITGKGAKGQGVLRRKVPEWLHDYPLKPHIIALSYASSKDGGSGALYVRLRRDRQSS